MVRGAAFTGKNTQLYASTPRTDFQRTMRKGAPAQVYNHVTRCHTAHVEQVCNLPPTIDADHMDLPEALKTDAMKEGRYDAKKDRRYRRLNIDEVFQACLSTLNPMGKSSRVCRNLFLEVHES